MSAPAEVPALAWRFQDAMRRALLARLGERVLSTQWEITPKGRETLAAEENAL